MKKTGIFEEIIKSTRHQKIIGNFGENMICNWLSRSGFEVAIVDHTGIDIIAYNKISKERLGITVKSRTRTRGKETDSVNIFYYQKGKNDRKKVEDACSAFGCIPWIGVYVETTSDADVYLTNLEHYLKKYQGERKKAIDDWKMTDKHREEYEKDSYVKHIKIEFNQKNWKW